MEDEEKGCYRCGREEEEITLYDAIHGVEIVKICEECIKTENMPIVQRPSSEQLRTAEKPYTVYERLNKMAGLQRQNAVKPTQEFVPRTGITLDKIRTPTDYNSRTLRTEGVELVKDKPLDLIDNYHWYVQTARRRRKLSQKQLADELGEREEHIAIIEEGRHFDNMTNIIDKLENYFKLRLKKSTPRGEREEIVLSKPVAKEDWAHIEERKEEQPMFVRQKPLPHILKVDKDKIKNLTIADLKRIKAERELLEKQQLENEDIKEEDKMFKDAILKKVEKNMSQKQIDDLIWRRSKEKKAIKKEKEDAEKLVEEAGTEQEEEIEEKQEKQEKQGFFSRIFKRKKKEEIEISDEDKEELDKIEIEED